MSGLPATLYIADPEEALTSKGISGVAMGLGFVAVVVTALVWEAFELPRHTFDLSRASDKISKVQMSGNFKDVLIASESVIDHGPFSVSKPIQILSANVASTRGETAHLGAKWNPRSVFFRSFSLGEICKWPIKDMYVAEHLKIMGWGGSSVFEFPIKRGVVPLNSETSCRETHICPQLAFAGFRYMLKSILSCLSSVLCLADQSYRIEGEPESEDGQRVSKNLDRKPRENISPDDWDRFGIYVRCFGIILIMGGYLCNRGTLLPKNYTQWPTYTLYGLGIATIGLGLYFWSAGMVGLT